MTRVTRSGEIGRRKALKPPYPVRGVQVRFLSPRFNLFLPRYVEVFAWQFGQSNLKFFRLLFREFPLYLL